jgi:FMN phosphatase YigB (HAD superfamily)
VAGAKRAGWQAIYIVQPGAPGYTDMPPELQALPPWERSAAGPDWLLARLEIDRRWHGYPPTEPEECIPDAIVTSLSEIPAAVAQLSSAAKA